LAERANANTAVALLVIGQLAFAQMPFIDSLRKLVAREYGVDVKDVTPETLLDETLGGNSDGVDLYEFYDEVEQKYGLAIGYDLLTVQQLADLISENRKATRWWRRRF